MNAKPHPLLGVSAALKRVEEDLNFAARSDAKVLITGESGVGKEVVARLIHHRSSRDRGPLVTINCAGVPDTLLASELFGHVRGSFTDAYTDKRGWLEQAHGGTVFMDEVGEMSPQMQGLLLRFLENGEIQRVGSDRRQTIVDVRVITATNRRLIDRVEAKEFREDLYYRLNVIRIDIPPLRSRPEDIPILFEHFIRQCSARQGVVVPRISPDALERLVGCQWPGNARQLRNVAEGLVVRARNGVITALDLPRDLFAVGPHASTGANESHEPPLTRVDTLLDRMMSDRESFWTAVYEPFMSRNITRDDLQEIVRRGLQLSEGNYKNLPSVFNIPADDYKRLVSFLRKFQAHSPIQHLHTARAELRERPTPFRRAIGE